MLKNGLQGLTLLLIEDELITQELMTDALEWAGAIVTLGINCESALALLKAKHFDLILSNIVLPDGSGYAMLRYWRLWEREHDLSLTPAIALTAAVRTVSQVEATAAGFQCFVSKPCDLDSLFSIVSLATIGTRHPLSGSS